MQNIPSWNNLQDLQKFAASWAVKNSGRTTEVFRVLGFCLMVRRSVVDRIGGLDERFGIGFFEDDDFCVRAAIAGFKARIARDVLIYHFHNQTFKGARIDSEKVSAHNWELFKAKWGIPPDQPYEQGYTITRGQPVVSRYYIPLIKERVVGNHQPDDARRWWQELTVSGQPSPGGAELIQTGKPLRESLSCACRLAEDFLKEGRHGEAEKILLNILKADPTYAPAYSNLAYLHWQEEDLEVACQMALEALKLAADDPDVVWNCGQIFAAFGREKEAYELYGEYLKRHPDQKEFGQALGDQ